MASMAFRPAYVAGNCCIACLPFSNFRFRFLLLLRREEDRLEEDPGILGREVHGGVEHG